jgi:hypothetical protein
MIFACHSDSRMTLLNEIKKEVMPMAKSQSESRLRGAEIPRFTRNKLRNLKGFA